VSDPHYQQRLVRSATEPPSRFSCRRSTIDGVAHVVLGGELDIANCTHLDAALRLAWASSDVVVVDLRELEFIDSSGTRLLVDADRRIRRAGGRLIVVRGPWEVDWLFVLLGIDRMLELVDSPPSLSRRQPAQALHPGASRLQPRLELRDADHRRASA